MALSAHVFTSKRRFPAIKGGFRHGILDITWGAVYATNGFAITPANLGLNRIYDLHVPAYVAGASGKYIPQVVFSSDTAVLIKMIVATTWNELANGSDDLDSVVMRIHYWGQ